MSKSKAQKRKRQAQAAASSGPPSKVTKTTTVEVSNGGRSPTATTILAPSNLHTVISDEELEITVETLETLSQYPSLIKGKSCKDLRVAVYDFRKASTTGNNASTDGGNLTSRITAALADEKYLDARILLAEMRIRSEEPKLGALCRWVRDLDVISRLSTVRSAEDAAPAVRSDNERDLLNVLDAVLRTVGPIDSNPAAVTHPTSQVVLQDIWDLRPSTPSEQVHAAVQNGTIFDTLQKDKISSLLRIIETTPALERKPPNHHDAILYTTAPDAVLLSQTPETPIIHEPHPVVPGLSLARNLLSPHECKSIIAAGEAANFVPDAPIRDDGQVSILAHNFYWVIDTAFHDKLWARIAPYVPSSINGRQARGINRRFRVYRYVPGAEYRCHIDGAWPPSGILPNDKYVYDASPPGKKQSSLFTFLLYLNDEFEGGETTFFLPSAKEGTLNAYPVRPVMGAVAIFPHGETKGALLHEGTGVRKGAKYIIRSDVEYDVEPTVGVD
ncbi:uncharacterized protein J7T54_004554 [Emericellopsis cladophorae]|uniref:Fe2OG dioxygenase domain-containing protein n=1 Tax=Emericellopsis cladophorae TaxID=2686198 RepID=A0A9P9Y672_9HYPO|nr:uncharacterized protein J7T54_004554 [Emericellopsis cladophorae]KAI6784008.1 hypothetical protein J7T54_004554 [Emericellopsis cladophorae]